MARLVVGLIGGMGGGKSRVAEEFRRRGAVVLAGDQLGHEALRQPEIREKIIHHWGAGVLNDRGEVDRRKLGRIVFADPAELRRLEVLLHPWIEGKFAEGIAAAEGLVVLDAAVLLEAGWDRLCDRVVFVEAPRARRLQRLAEQRGWDANEVEARERAQLPLAEKARRADDVIDNSGPPEDAARQVETLMRRWGFGPPAA